jgi:hypothetical protein
LSSFCAAVEWLPISWEAIATFATGGLAVIGATVVGWRQGTISKTTRDLQKQIADDDLKIRQQSLRIELLDQRSKCVSAMREIVGNWNRDMSLSDDNSQKFQTLLWDAQLLFPPEVVAKIKQAVEGTFWSDVWAKRSQYYHKIGDAERGKAKLEQSYHEEDKAMAVMPDLVDMLVEHTRVGGWQQL